MTSLREKMAAFGFESNEDYEYQIRCLLESHFEGIRCLDIEGEPQRRKTAFAAALAEALEFPRVIYHDFSERNPLLMDVMPMKGELPPIDIVDQRLSEACAFSEADDTILILDQLHKADFRDHIRLYRFVMTGEWIFRNHQSFANPKHLIIFFISAEPLYHSLRKQSFRIWVETISTRLLSYQPHDFGLDDGVLPVMEALDAIFAILQVGPTKSEYVRLLSDILKHVRARDQLRHSIFGRVEGVERVALFADALNPALERTINAIIDYIASERVELT